MIENSNPREERDENGRSNTREAEVARPVTDREVPLGSHRMQPAIHAWLDGELPESAVRRGDMVRDVEFWQRVNRETETRRQVRAPLSLAESIMNALPETTPTTVSVEPSWWSKPVTVTPGVVLAAGAGLFALGMAVQAIRSR
jgi:hypothetical protein